jgi:chemotaxis family two-component system response regulator Rcp1
VTVALTSRRTILLVEDNAADAALAVEALGRTASAPRVVLARSGLLALEGLREPAADPRPDVVLLDLNLPGFDGLATLGALKSDPRLRRIPVVILTTSKSQDEIDRCYELGAAAVLNKPLRLRDYRAMIDAFERFWLCQVRFGETE